MMTRETDPINPAAYPPPLGERTDGEPTLDDLFRLVKAVLP